MDQFQEENLLRVQELLKPAGEFIAYFELAETKMMEWCNEIDQQSFFLQNQSHTISNQLQSMHDLLSNTGAENALKQQENSLKNLELSCKLFREELQLQQAQIKQLTQTAIEKIDHHSQVSLQNMTTLLAKYDVHQFHRIASESCDHVERTANHAVHKTNKLFKKFQLRLGIFLLFSTLLTSFSIALFLSDELPWEMHHQASKERQAGKLLLQAWSSLDQLEKNKILHSQATRNG